MSKTMTDLTLNALMALALDNRSVACKCAQDTIDADSHLNLGHCVSACVRDK